MRARHGKAILWLAVGGTVGGVLLGGCGPGPSRRNVHPPVQPVTATDGPASPVALSESSQAPAKTVDWGERGVRLSYPSDWRPRKSADYELLLLPSTRPNSSRSDAAGTDRRITMDIPDLPPHLPWMIQMGRIEHDYVEDLRKQHPDLKVDEASDANLPNSKSRLVRLSWRQNEMAYHDVALLIIHADGVYILDAQSDGDHYPATRRAFDLIRSSLRWTR